VRLTFQTLDEGGYKLIVEDDGQGLVDRAHQGSGAEEGFIPAGKGANPGYQKSVSR